MLKERFVSQNPNISSSLVEKIYKKQLLDWSKKIKENVSTKCIIDDTMGRFYFNYQVTQEELD